MSIEPLLVLFQREEGDGKREKSDTPRTERNANPTGGVDFLRVVRLFTKGFSAG